LCHLKKTIIAISISYMSSQIFFWLLLSVKIIFTNTLFFFNYNSCFISTYLHFLYVEIVLAFTSCRNSIGNLHFFQHKTWRISKSSSSSMKCWHEHLQGRGVPGGCWKHAWYHPWWLLHASGDTTEWAFSHLRWSIKAWLWKIRSTILSFICYIHQLKRKFGSLINGCSLVFFTKLNNDNRDPLSFIGMDAMVRVFSLLNWMVWLCKIRLCRDLYIFGSVGEGVY